MYCMFYAKAMRWVNMMQLCNTSDLVKGLTKRLSHFTLITNVTSDLVELRITRQESAVKFCMEQKT